MNGQNQKILKRFHKDIATLKAHHWKNFFDLYQGCLHNCIYCLYRYDENFGKNITPISKVNTSRLAKEFDNVKPVGITYLGATSDIYQPVEKRMELVRPILSVFCEKRLPLVIATKSLLIRRDIDLLSQLARDGLIEVSITMITLDEGFAKFLEPGAPVPKDRLNIARELTSNGIPVSFHVAPLIPGYFNDVSLREFITALQKTGASGAYGCILGMRRPYKENVLESIRIIDSALAEYLSEIYGSTDGSNAVSPLTQVVFAEMERFSRICKDCGFEFYCEHIPPLDTNTRMGGIFRFKLPTTGDMYRHFKEQGKQEVIFDDLEEYLANFSAVDVEYRSLVVSFWQAGILFQDTDLVPIGIEPENYVFTDSIKLKVGEVMTCD